MRRFALPQVSNALMWLPTTFPPRCIWAFTPRLFDHHHRHGRLTLRRYLKV
ncbi:MAG: hypothetical protein ACLT98_09435 [Eggerthellaceae bacterium]